ncbi:MAG: hypothetical protein R3C39_15555 [Dehalococcoidia bacterium]
MRGFIVGLFRLFVFDWRLFSGRGWIVWSSVAIAMIAPAVALARAGVSAPPAVTIGYSAFVCLLAGTQAGPWERRVWMLSLYVAMFPVAFLAFDQFAVSEPAWLGPARFLSVVGVNLGAFVTGVWLAAGSRR